MSVYLITGVQGVGKSTVCCVLHNTLPAARIHDYADFMLEATKISDKDLLSSIPASGRQSIYEHANDLLRRMLGVTPDVILEAHLSVEIGEDSFLSFSPKDHAEVQVAGIVVVEANPRSVWGRRSTDTARRRRHSSPASINAQQQINRVLARFISEELAIPMLRVNNTRADKCASRITQWLGRVGLSKAGK